MVQGLGGSSRVSIRIQFLWAVFFMVLAGHANSQSVVVGGKEWLQPVDFVNVTWLDVDVACPGGVCSGLLSGTDITGYNWATVAEVNELFINYGVPFIGSTPQSVSVAGDSTWGPAFFGDFSPTGVLGSQLDMYAWTQNTSPDSPNPQAYLGRLNDSPSRDDAETSYTLDRNLSFPDIGAWLWRDAPYDVGGRYQG